MATLLTSICQGPVPVVTIDAQAACGAECIFIGRTRRETHPEHGDLERLEYEMYEPMVSRLLSEMAHNAATRWNCGAVRIVHAKGPVGLGEASVVIQVLTPHRADAFEACHHLIDRLKQELPVWKREIWQRGETFVEGWSVNMKNQNPKSEARNPRFQI